MRETGCVVMTGDVPIARVAAPLVTEPSAFETTTV